MRGFFCDLLPMPSRTTLLALLLLALVLAPSARADGWPFGGGQRKLDLFNLGLLGIKASDASKPPPSNEPPRQGRRQSSGGRGGGDEGPESLRVEFLFPDGPGAKAGLAKGDVLVGIGKKKFTDGSSGAIAAALLKAESSKGEVVLLVKKAGSGAPKKVLLHIPAAGKQAKKPTTGAGRAALIDAALKWLAERQESDGGFDQTLAGPNGAMIQASMAGLAWLGAGSDLTRGPYKDNLRKAADFVIANIDKLGDGKGGERAIKANWNQSNWGYAHVAIFLGELHARSPDRGVLESLHYCGRRLVETQEPSGGWAHGPGGKNALDYLELNIVTGLALGGLGLAQQSGFEVPRATLAKAEEYLTTSGGGDGGVAYSASPGQAGSGNIGRTAGTWMGYLALGRGKTKWAKKMAGYVKRNADKMLGGHASLMQHYLLAGVAAQVHSKGAAKTYWEMAVRDLVLARSPDGSFQPRPWRESISMGSNSDCSFGEVWTTAAWAVVLVASPTKDGSIVGFPAWSGAKR